MKAPAVHGPFTAQDARADPGNHLLTLANHDDWTPGEVTAPVPRDADRVAFGVFLGGPGQIDLRDLELIRSESA